MDGYTRLTKLQVDELLANTLKLANDSISKVTAANAAAAAGDTPTKAEFDMVVTLANALKDSVNAMVDVLKA